MKKIYINPDTKVVCINTSSLLVESNVGYQGNYDSQKVTIGSRRAWSDEDDD